MTDELFPSLEPPPGGLAALRARLGQDRRLPLGRLGVLVVAACALALWLWPRRPPSTLRDDLAARHYATMVSLGLSPAPEEPVAALGGSRALRRVVASPALVLYVAESR